MFFEEYRSGKRSDHEDDYEARHYNYESLKKWEGLERQCREAFGGRRFSRLLKN